MASFSMSSILRRLIPTNGTLQPIGGGGRSLPIIRQRPDVEITPTLYGTSPVSPVPPTVVPVSPVPPTVVPVSPVPPTVVPVNSSKPFNPIPRGQIGPVEALPTFGVNPPTPSPSVPDFASIMRRLQSTQDLPFDPEYEASIQDILRQRAGLESNYGLTKDRLGQDYSQLEGRLGEQFKTGTEDISESFAGRGLFRSGIHLGEQGKLGKEYQGQVSDIGQDRSRTLDDLTRAFTGDTDTLESFKSQLSAERIRRAAIRELEKAQQEANTFAANESLNAEKIKAEEESRKTKNALSQFESSLPSMLPTGQYKLNIPQYNNAPAAQAPLVPVSAIQRRLAPAPSRTTKKSAPKSPPYRNRGRSLPI
jgi:hypothetical protein